jgi:mono/diheme cytochrome c family protein
VAVSEALMRRGQERWEVFCTPCHGSAGYGDGPVARRADRLQEGTWTPPSSLHTDLVRSRPAGYLFNTVTNGVRNMPAYGSQIPVHDRWAIVAYMRALQRSQNATVADVPVELRQQLR